MLDRIREQVGPATPVELSGGGTLRVLRLDDLGASSKQYEQYARHRWANVGFLKRLPGLKAWGPYPELHPWLLEMLCAFVDACGSTMTVAVTAAWVEKNGSLTPYPQKFPEQAKVLKTWHDRGVIEVANHGLTHCVVGKHRPKFLGTNRMYHREFVASVPLQTLVRHLWESQRILRQWLGECPVTLIPSGHVWREDLTPFAEFLGLHVERSQGDSVVVHDREIVIGGGWETWQEIVAREKYTTCRESRASRVAPAARGGGV